MGVMKGGVTMSDANTDACVTAPLVMDERERGREIAGKKAWVM